jgi:hypothetical protein
VNLKEEGLERSLKRGKCHQMRRRTWSLRAKTVGREGKYSSSSSSSSRIQSGSHSSRNFIS